MHTHTHMHIHMHAHTHTHTEHCIAWALFDFIKIKIPHVAFFVVTFALLKSLNSSQKGQSKNCIFL